MIMKAKALTPVHIGTSTKLPAISFIHEVGAAKAIDIGRLAEECKDNPGELTAAIESGKPLSGELKEKAAKTAKYSLTSHIQNAGNCKDILECVKDIRHEAYLPGSSIKGAIRTAILYRYSLSDKGENLFQRDGRDLRRLRQSFEDFLTDPMKKLKIGDSTSTSRMGLYDAAVLSLKQDNTLLPKTNMRIYLETIEKGEEFTMQMNAKEFKWPTEKIADCCNRFSLAQLKKDSDFFEDYGEPAALNECGKIINEMAAPAKNQFLLRVGWGCGNIGTSLNLSMPDGLREAVSRTFTRTRPGVFPKTRRLTSTGHTPFGWLLCTLEC